MKHPLRLFLTSLGCPKNRVDSEVMAGTLARAGWVLTREPETADLLLVNTCSFISDAKEESVDTILELARVKEAREGVKLVVTGCLVQQHQEELGEELPEVDLFLGAGQAGDILVHLERLMAGAGARMVARAGGDCYLPEGDTPRFLDSPGSAFLKLSDGCSRACAFCTIPAIKGPMRCRTSGSVLEEARNLVGQGVKELILIGQDISRYQGPEPLAQLLDRLAEVEGLEWIRLMYLYPDSLDQALLERLVKGGKVLPYVDMPIQHVDDRVLRLMRRATGEALVRGAVNSILTLMPDAALRTTVLVGFPGETEAAFENLLGFVREGHFHNLGVFGFSPEPGTPAATMADQVDPEVVEARRTRIMEAQAQVSRARNQALVGRRLPVLIEGSSPDHEWVLTGRIYTQAPEIDGLTYLELLDGQPGDLVEVQITEATDYDLVAGPVE